MAKKERNDGAALEHVTVLDADVVNHPRHYTRGRVECIDALESAVAGRPPDEAILVANAIKYLWRYDDKEPVRSLESARWYVDRLIAKVKARYGMEGPCGPTA